jgi:hypothetical protein
MDRIMWSQNTAWLISRATLISIAHLDFQDERREAAETMNPI